MFEVTRSQWRAGARRDVAGAATRAFVLAGESGGRLGRRIYGLAIADRSEVRGVRLDVTREMSGATSAALAPNAERTNIARGTLELVEGAPLEFVGGIDAGSTIAIERLDAHDGRIVLAAALTPAAVDLLPRVVQPVSRLVLGYVSEAGAATGEVTASGITIYLAPPRGASSVTRQLAGRLFNVGSTQDVTVHGVCRDHAGNILFATAALATVTLAAGVQTEIPATELDGCTHAALVMTQTTGAGPMYGEVQVF